MVIFQAISRSTDCFSSNLHPCCRGGESTLLIHFCKLILTSDSLTHRTALKLLIKGHTLETVNKVRPDTASDVHCLCSRQSTASVAAGASLSPPVSFSSFYLVQKG